MPLFISQCFSRRLLKAFVRAFVSRAKLSRRRCARIAPSLTSSMARMRGVRSPVLTAVEYAP